jgi:hypothetical protein
MPSAQATVLARLRRPTSPGSHASGEVDAVGSGRTLQPAKQTARRASMSRARWANTGGHVHPRTICPGWPAAYGRASCLLSGPLVRDHRPASGLVSSLVISVVVKLALSLRRHPLGPTRGPHRMENVQGTAQMCLGCNLGANTGHTYALRHEVSPLAEALDLGRIGQSDGDYIR